VVKSRPWSCSVLASGDPSTMTVDLKTPLLSPQQASQKYEDGSCSCSEEPHKCHLTKALSLKLQLSFSPVPNSNGNSFQSLPEFLLFLEKI